MLVSEKRKEKITMAALVLADISLTGIIWWVVVGLIAGFLASLVMRGGGYGIVGDIIVGIVGAIIGGFPASPVGPGSPGLIGTIIIALIVACMLIANLRARGCGCTPRTF